MLDRRRVTGLAALSMTAVGAVLGMEGSAFPTAKDPGRHAVGGGWIFEAQDRLHFALSAHLRDGDSWGTFNLRSQDDRSAFWADVQRVVIREGFATVEGTVRKAEGAYEGCTDQRFQLSAQDGEQVQRGVDALQGACEGGAPFGGEVQRGNIRIDDAGISGPQ